MRIANQVFSNIEPTIYRIERTEEEENKHQATAATATDTDEEVVESQNGVKQYPYRKTTTKLNGINN